MRYRYTVELTVNELEFDGAEAEELRRALQEAAEEYADGLTPVKVLCEDGWCIEKNDARIRAALLGMRLRAQNICHTRAGRPRLNAALPERQAGPKPGKCRGRRKGGAKYVQSRLPAVRRGLRYDGIGAAAGAV